MAIQGATSFSLRGDGPWQGMTTQSRAKPGHFELLENCYVSSDGQEIRPIPGFKTFIDLVGTGGRTTGTVHPAFYQDVIDARRVVATTTGSYNYFDTSGSETMYVWAPPTSLHGVEQVAGRWMLFGESGHRREPIRDSASGTRWVHVTAYAHDAATGGTTLTLNEAYRATTNEFNSARPPANGAASGYTHKLYLEGLTGPGASFLNNLAHTIYYPPTGGPPNGFPTATTIVITTSIGGAGNNSVDPQTGLISRVSIDNGSTFSTVTDDEDALTIWTITDEQISLPIQATNIAYVANRQRDFADAAGDVREGQFENCSRRRQALLPYRLVPCVSGNRLLMAAPGYSCVFQAPMTIPLSYEGTSYFGLSWVSNDIYDKPRCVGVPKAVMWTDTIRVHASGSAHTYAGASAANSFGGSDVSVSARTGVYKFAVAYKDEITGEVGLPSEIVDITTDSSAAFEGIRLFVTFPGYMIPETMALSVLIYRSQKNGNELYFDRVLPAASLSATSIAGTTLLSAKYGLRNAGNEHLFFLELPWTSDEELSKHVGSVPSIEQMPMGCKAVRTVRGGWTVYGGALGNAGPRRELISSTLSWAFDKNAATNKHYNTPDIVYSVFATNTGLGLSTHGKWGGAGTCIYPAYAGQEIFSKELFPAPRQIFRLDTVINNLANDDTTWPAEPQRSVRFRVAEPHAEENKDGTRTSKTTFLRLPRGAIQISEADNPGVVPATNTTIISKEATEDVEGIGEANGQLVVCTRSKTYYLGYGQSPVGVPGELASDHFGCIGANTMVSFDHGCAWISDRGPCAIIGGSFQWIGQDVQHLFTGDNPRYLRDSLGMMRHAWGAHDPERGLLYFGLFANRANGTADEATARYSGTSATWDASNFQDERRSRFPCDEVLVYSYRANAWSVWRPPLKLLIKWMTSGTDAFGKRRMFFLGSDDRVYMMDDQFSQWNADAIVATVSTGTTGTTLTTGTTFAADSTARGTANNYWNAGMDVLVVSGTDNHLIKKTTLVSASGTTVTLADSVTVAAGDKVHVGVRTFTIKSNYFTLKKSETARVAAPAISYSLESRYGSGGSVPHVAFANVLAQTTVMVDGVPTADSRSFTGDETADSYAFLGTDTGDQRVIDQRFVGGAVQGTNARVEMIFSGGSGVRINDLHMEIQ